MDDVCSKIVRVQMLINGITVNDLAKTVGVSRQYLWSVLSGRVENKRVENLIYKGVTSDGE